MIPISSTRSPCKIEPLQQLLMELTSKDLLRGADSASRRRARKLSSTLIRFKGNIVSFRTTSGTHAGKFWNQTIQLKALAKQLNKVRDGKISLVKAINIAVNQGDVLVHCNCPAQKYWGWAYITTVRGAKFGRKQKIFPSIRNPRLKGTICKHLINALSSLPFNMPTLVKRAKKRGIV